VDVTPQVEQVGANRIRDFMLTNADAGFASLDEAADAVAAYNPHRPRPKSSEGLKKNLRLRDGRYYWHWDPRFLKGEQRVGLEFERLEAAARQVKCPVLLVRGLLSDVVSDRSVQALREAIPHLEYVETKDAGHMVSGDRNDIFLSDLQGFLARHTRR
jgi:pimeloyl-ACP methyl ester carboxylesterase